MAGFVTAYLAHQWVRLSCVLVMHHAAMLDGPALDALTLQQDGLPPAEIDSLYDSAAMRNFVGIELGNEAAPDETTICKFRHLIENNGLGKMMLTAVNDHLKSKGIKIGTGTIMDATLISAPSSTKNEKGERDPEMHQTQKGNQWYFGMKGHIGVDSKERVIHAAEVTAANVHDSQMVPSLLHGTETKVWGDTAYQGQTEAIRAAAPAAVTSMREFIAYAKQRPGDLTYASAGVGSMHHLGAELLKLRAGIDMLHVPYRGTGETIRDLIAGRVHFYMNSPPPLTPLVADGKLRALCVSSNERHPGMPNIPSAKEEGLADLDLNVWFSLFAPRGTPEPVARLLAQKLNEVLTDPAIRKRAFDAGALVVPSSPEALAARMERETAAWAEVVRAAKITAG